MISLMYFYQIVAALASMILLFNKKSYIWFDKQLKKFFVFLLVLWIFQAISFFLNLPLVYNFAILFTFIFSIFYFLNFFVGNFLGHSYRVYFFYNKSAEHMMLFRRLFLLIIAVLYFFAVFLNKSLTSSVIIFLLTNLLLTIVVFYAQINYFYIYLILLFFNITIYVSVILIFGSLFSTNMHPFFSILMYMLAATLYYPLYWKFNLYIQKFYYRPDKDYNFILKNFLKTMLVSLDVQELADKVCQFVYDELEIDYIQLYLFNNRHSNYVMFTDIGKSPKKKDFIDTNFVEFLEKHKGLVHSTLFNITRVDHILKDNNIKLIVPLIFDSKLLGFINIGQKRNRLEFISGDKNFLESVGYYTSITVSNIIRYNALKRSYWNSVRALSNAIDAKDEYTKGHSERVVYYSVIIGKEMGLDKKDLDLLKFGGILHDVGKIAIDDAIIKKETGLTSIEREIIKSHPVEGEKIILPITFLKDVRKIVRHHHERWDGMGYPDQLFKKEIPFLARIIQVVDTFDAMTSSRAYRNEQTLDRAVNEIQRCSGTQFDPMIVYYFVKAVKKRLIKKLDIENIDFDELV